MKEIIGGGILGCCLAIELKKQNPSEVIRIYEMNKLLNSPYCHLHKGGFLYPETDLNSCFQLYEDCLLFEKEFSHSILNTSTIICFFKDSKYKPNDLIQKCKIFKDKYNEFEYSILENNDEILKSYNIPYDSISYPIVLIKEGLIDKMKLDNYIISTIDKLGIEIIKEYKEIGTKNVINASGAYTSNYEIKCNLIIETPNIINKPELVIIGERDTELGMIQITPIENKYIVHKMNRSGSIIGYSDTNDHIVDSDNRIKYLYNQFTQLVKTDYNFMKSEMKLEIGKQRILSNDTHNRNSIVNSNDIHLMKACSVIRVVLDFCKKRITK